jgi:Fic family protein
MDWDSLTKKKNLLDKYKPLPLELVANLDEWFKIELTYTSNAIEGNTLTRQETALVVEKGIAVGGKSLREHLEAINHAKAWDWIRNFSNNKSRQITEKDILAIHEIILKTIDDNNSGRYRNVAVRISGSTVVLPNPLKVPTLMKTFVSWLNAGKKMHPVELAAEAHYRLVSIHPFIDGNGRTARLLMNLILMLHNYPPAIIQKQTRLKYLRALEQAQLGGSIVDYQKLIYQAAANSLNIYLQMLRQSKPKPTKPKEKRLRIGLKK